MRTLNQIRTETNESRHRAVDPQNRIDFPNRCSWTPLRECSHRNGYGEIVGGWKYELDVMFEPPTANMHVKSVDFRVKLERDKDVPVGVQHTYVVKIADGERDDDHTWDSTAGYVEVVRDDSRFVYVVYDGLRNECGQVFTNLAEAAAFVVYLDSNLR